MFKSKTFIDNYRLLTCSQHLSTPFDKFRNEAFSRKLALHIRCIHGVATGK